MKPQRLRPCPASPNCVSSFGDSSRRRMDPIPYETSLSEARTVLAGIISGMKRSRIEAELDDYIHATFRSRLFGFVDDAEFLLDDSNKVIHFRSASRTGYYDFGVNRRRILAITKAFLGSQ